MATIIFSTPYANAMDGEDHIHPETSMASVEELKLLPNEITLRVHGVVCSFCAQGIQKKLAKLDFVDTQRHQQGVFTHIEKQIVKVAIQEGKEADIGRIHDEIKKGGYEPVSAHFLKNGKAESVVWEKE